MTLNDVNIPTIRVNGLGELKEAYSYVVDHKDEYETVIIDSITEIGEMIVSELKQHPDYSELNASMKLWMKFSEVMLAIAKSFRDIDGMNVIILALPESVQVGYQQKILPMIPAKKVQAKLGSLYDEVILIQVDEEGKRQFICQPTGEFDAKDRSGKLPQVVDYDKDSGIADIFKIIKGNKQ